MNAIDILKPAGLASVTVSFNPNVDILEKQIDSLPTESFKMIVDNASETPIVEALAALATTTVNTHLLRNKSNVGLPAALNIGVRALKHLAPQARFVLLLDQDSEPTPGSVPALVTAYNILAANGELVGCVGPNLTDVDTGLMHGFHQCTRWRWRRAYPSPGSSVPIRCGNLNGSGTLMKISLFEQLGGLDESFFIDHVDTEWSFRLLARGYTLWGIPNAVFLHRMGEGSLRYWLLGWRVWPQRSPRRHYYLFRNALWLMKRPYVPHAWKFWAAVKLALTLTVHVLFDTQRYAQFRAMTGGLKEGLQRW